MTSVHICMLVALVLGIGSVSAGLMLINDKADEFCIGFTGICGLGCIASIGAVAALIIMGGAA